MFKFNFTSVQSHLLSITKICDIPSLVSNSQLGMVCFTI